MVYKESATKSSKYAHDLIYPKIKKLGYIGGIIKSTEDIDNDDQIVKILDKICGIDALSKDGNIIYTISNRIQYGKSYNSFTIRHTTGNGSTNTEYKKRKLAIENGGLYPEYIIQSYIDYCGSLLSIGIAKTINIIKYIDDEQPELKTNLQDGSLFYPIFWKNVKMVGEWHINDKSQKLNNLNKFIGK